MILISHRGNINGREIEKENTKQHILNALKKGYDVEIDVWFIDGSYYLGHDTPEHPIEEDFLMNDKFWCHCKNIKCLEKLILNENVHTFYHQTDDVTLTSKKYLWTYPGKLLTTKSIAVLPENVKNWDLKNVQGICSDNISLYK